MQTVFIDANIILDFYRFGKDDIEEMKKLLKLISDNEIKLLWNKQLNKEINRNRENIIVEKLAEFDKAKPQTRVPRTLETLDNISTFKEALKEANKLHSQILSEARKLAQNKKLPADLLIDELRDSAEMLPDADSIELAILRVQCGDPPGKQGSIGDAIHWETLLASTHYSIYIISRDGDWYSQLSPKELRQTLKAEWSDKKQYSHIQIFPSLSEFFSKRFPEIRLSDEYKKDELISALEQSESFATTREIVSSLSEFSFFTKAQKRHLFNALIGNRQIRWISQDENVQEFYRKLVPIWLEDENLHSKAEEILKFELLPF